ncbi:MAG: MarR family transcriptional regulator [Ktedonobacteraceae bacterium]
MTTDSVSPTTHEAPSMTGILEPEYSVLRIWLRLLTCTTLIEHEVSGRLRSDFETTLPRFDLMAQLARCPEGLGMGELSERMMVSGGNITGITDNLERDGLVERIIPPEDRRAKKVRLTSRGRAAFDKMAAEHKIWIQDLLGHLTEQEQLQLYALLGKLKQGILAAEH